MKITAKEWVLFTLIAAVSFCIWLNLGYPRFSFVDLTIDKNEALRKAQIYLESRKVDTKSYSKAIIFDVDDWADRYLQKTIGFKGEEEFIRRHTYELFFWQVRFFKELKKEEYVIQVSPKSGEVLGFAHLIEDVEPRKETPKDIARRKAEEFLKKNSGINFADYDFHEEKVERFENRIDYDFSWEKKGVNIAWKKNEGVAKLLTGVTVSGDEIRQFFQGNLDIPEKFQRYITKELMLGEYLFSFYFLIITFLFIFSIFIVVKKRQNVIVRFSKKIFLSLAALLLIVNLLDVFNNFQAIIFAYPTSVGLSSFIGIYLIKVIINLILLSFTFLMPGVAGESLRSEVLPQKHSSSLAHYFISTFFSRSVAKAVLFGYILFFVMLGLQAGIFYFGQRYFGVWKEWLQLTHFSSSYIPSFSVFVIGITASLNEETIFRLFGISWAKRYLKNTVAAVIFASLVWGFGHSEYAIFPTWFRGIEVSIIGLLYGFIFLRYGLIPLIVAHYTFDVFWGSAAYLLGRAPKDLFIGSVFILALPLLFALIAYFLNRADKEREIKVLLDSTQEYNLQILITFILARKSQGVSAQVIKEELVLHNWDSALVDLALKAVFKNGEV